MSQGNTIELTVYVTGAPFAVSINTHQKVEELVRKALNEAGKRGVDPAGWVLRFEGGGAAIDHQARVGDVAIVDGMKLSLDRDEGGGGDAVVL